MPFMPPMPPSGGLPGAGGPPGLPGMGGGPDLASLMGAISGKGLPTPPGPPGGSPMEMLMPFMAGAGFQNLLAGITKFLKIISTTGTREDKSVRVPMQGASGSMDQAAMQVMQARQAMPQMGAMPGGPPPGMGI